MIFSHLQYRQQPDSDDENTLKRSKSKTNLLRGGIRGKQGKSADKRKTNGAAMGNGAGASDPSGDDPYYCGLRARVPNFAKNKARAACVRYEAYAKGCTLFPMQVHFEENVFTFKV